MNRFSAICRSGTLAICAAVALAASSALAQPSYPNKMIRLIVPFGTGGTTDIVARVMSEALGRALGQPVIVENRAGGGGTVGALEIARAVPDGYVLGMGTVSTTAANPAINPKISYDPLTDFTPVVNIAATPNVLVVHPSFPARNYQELVAELKAHPGKYPYASGGTGSISHLQMEQFKGLTGTAMTHIPYRGDGPSLTDTVAGQVLILFGNLPSALPFIETGRLRAIAVAAPQRLPMLRNVPTFEEIGLPSMNRMAYFGIVGPKGLPKDVVDRVNGAVRKVLLDPAVRKRIAETGSVEVGNSPDQFAEQIRAEFESYRKIVAEQNLTLE